MAISIGQRDEYIEGIPRQREEIVRFGALAAKSRHRRIVPIFAVAINGIVACFSDGRSGTGTSLALAALIEPADVPGVGEAPRGSLEDGRVFDLRERVVAWVT